MELQKYSLRNGKPDCFGSAFTYKIQDHTWFFEPGRVGLRPETDFEKRIMDNFVLSELPLTIEHIGGLPSINPILGFLLFDKEINNLSERTELVRELSKRDLTHLFYSAGIEGGEPNILTFSPKEPSHNYSLEARVPITIGPYTFRGQEIDFNPNQVYIDLVYGKNPVTHEPFFEPTFMRMDKMLVIIAEFDNAQLLMPRMVKRLEQFLANASILEALGEGEFKPEHRLAIKNTLNLYKRINGLLLTSHDQK